MVCSASPVSMILKGSWRNGDPYLADHAQWLKIRNHSYSQWAGREELFERERVSDPEFEAWATCVQVCELVEAQLIDAN